MFSGLRLGRRRFVQATGLAALSAPGTVGSVNAESGVDPGEVFDHLDRAAISVFAHDLRSGDVIAEHGTERPVAPASTTKLLTTAAAFDELGPEYEWETTVGAVGGSGGRTIGTLGVVARGAPDLTPEDLTELAEAVADAGVRRVTDRLVVDVSAFDSPLHGPAWTLADARFAYGAPSSAFALSRNVVDVTVSRPGEDCSFETNVEPEGDVAVDLDVDCGDEDSLTIDNRTHWDNTIPVTGTLSPGGEGENGVPVGEPDRHTAAAFVDTLSEAGVELTPRDGGEPRIEITREPIEIEEFGSVSSQPLAEIADDLNAWSRNFVAENVARTVAYETTGTGSFANWEAHLNALFSEVGAETAQIRDGSGLSRQDLASARDVTRTIDWGVEQEWGDRYRETIPIAGEEGTVRNRLTDVDATIRAKSGTLSGVTCLAGVVEDDDGSPAASFAVLAANLTGERAQGASDRVDELVTLIAEAV
jgi:serine-type D-Ala-D-Ala carboxypeptidase/endopeptidase (penicillin-binding protein 4)